MRLTNRWSIALCSGLVILAACDTSHTPLVTMPEEGPGTALVPAPSSLVAFYSFDHGAGDGTVSPGATHRPAGGYEGGAFHFNGTGAYIDLPVDVNPSTRPAVTMGAWFKAESLPADGRPVQVLSHDNGGFDRSIGLDMRASDGGVPDGRYHVSTFTGTGVLPGPVADTARWTFVAAVYDETSVTLYVDGQAYSQPAGSGEGFDFLRVGGNPGGFNGGEPMAGLIDNVFVYDRALTAEEIATIHTGGACAIQGTCEAPRRVYFYPFDTDAGDGTVRGAVLDSAGGYQGGAYYFNGNGAHIDLPIDVNPSAMPRVTIGAWVRVEFPLSGGALKILSHNDGGFDRGISLDRRTSPRSLYSWYDISASTGSGVYGRRLEQGMDWTFVAAVYDQGTVTLYVNGSRYPSAPATPGQGFPFLRVGGSPAGSESGESFHGWVDNVFVVNRALSPEQVQAIHYCGVCIAGSAPIITMGGPYEATEGIGRLLSLSVADPSGEPLSLVWDLGDGTKGTGPLPKWHVYTDDGTYTITVIATNSSGLSTTDSTLVSVSNERPRIVGNSESQVLLVGDYYADSVSFIDHGADSWTATINYGDSSVDTMALAGKSFTLRHRYVVPGTYWVVVSVTDDDGGEGRDTIRNVVLSPQDAINRIQWSVQAAMGSGQPTYEQALQAYNHLRNAHASLNRAYRSFAGDNLPQAVASFRSTLRSLDQVLELLQAIGISDQAPSLTLRVRALVASQLAATESQLGR